MALDRTFEQWNVRLVFCRLGGVTLEIAAPLGSKEDPPKPLAEDDDSADLDRLWGFTWQVEDANAAHSRLDQAGVVVSAVREGRRPGTRVLTVKSATCSVPTLLIEPAQREG